MELYYWDDDITIIHGDCREVLPLLETDSADAVITDPPYGIGFDYGEYQDDPSAYPALMRQWLSEAHRIVSDGPFFVWQAMSMADHWHDWFPPGYRLFAACKGFVQYRPQPVQHSWDPVVFWGTIPGAADVFRKDFRIQTLAPFGAGRGRIDHPCPRPLEQVRYIVSLATTPSQTILDPFMGSGTTLRAAKDLGRKAIGIEINEDYCRLAIERLSQEVLL